jgi:hypothetical protein
MGNGQTPKESAVEPMSRRRRSEEKALEALSESRTAQQELSMLQKQLKRQHVLIHALWEVMKKKLSLSDDDLLATVKAVEAAEEESQLKAETCPSCGRAIQKANRSMCIYCGADVESREIF